MVQRSDKDARFLATPQSRFEFRTAREMAAANREHFVRQAEESEVASLDRLLFENAQKLIEMFNDANMRNELLNDEFSSDVYILLGNNGRAVSTFTFEDDSRVVSIDLDVFREVCVLVYALSREQSYGPWLGAWLFYHNMGAVRTSFPLIGELFYKCAKCSPVIFDSIARSSLYLLIFHEVGHEYISRVGTGHAWLTSDVPDEGDTYRKTCYNPPHGPKYTILLRDDGQERLFVPDKEWAEEFAADVFAMLATLSLVGGSNPSFEAFERTIHHISVWQLVIYYVSVGNLFRHDQDRTSHPSAHNRVDNLVFHLEPIGVHLFGDWQSEALTILQKNYACLFSSAFTTSHRTLGERVMSIQPLAEISDDTVSVEIYDKPPLMSELTLILENGLMEQPLEDWGDALEAFSSPIKYGYAQVFADMADAVRGMGLRFENDD